ncbi:MAG TPA: inorganic diphosphatase [Terriglobales bacterium]|nr:inorganic diphosphatase [Terriglobales bacterium]
MKRANHKNAKKNPSLEVIIETPRGSRNKYKYEPSNKSYKLSKVMPEGMVFPYDFGCIPATKAEDGDPLDVLVLTDEPLFPGCLIDCKLIGVIEAEQEEEGETNRNDRLIAVANQSLLYSEVENLHGLNPVVLKQIKDFFVNYQRVRDVRVKILGHYGPERALEVLQRAATHKHAA